MQTFHILIYEFIHFVSIVNVCMITVHFSYGPTFGAFVKSYFPSRELQIELSWVYMTSEINFEFTYYNKMRL